jgi:hypothetical protein
MLQTDKKCLNMAQTEHVFLQSGAALNQSSHQAANLENYKCKNKLPSLKSIT